MHPGERLVVGLCLGWVMLCAQPAQAQTWTLAAVVRETLARNPDIALARARIDEAAAQLAQARAAFMPQLGLSSQYHWTNNPLMAFGSILNQRSFTPDLDFNDVPAVDDLHLRATVRLPLYAALLC
ncbi:MAG: TolC family protein [Polyangiales bacterium]